MNKTADFWREKTAKAAKKLIRTGQLVSAGGGIYRFSEYVDDLDVYVANRRAKTKRVRVARSG
jgi:hypothetical protein